MAARWATGRSEYDLEIETPHGTIIHDKCHVLINACGLLKYGHAFRVSLTATDYCAAIGSGRRSLGCTTSKEISYTPLGLTEVGHRKTKQLLSLAMVRREFRFYLRVSHSGASLHLMTDDIPSSTSRSTSRCVHPIANMDFHAIWKYQEQEPVGKPVLH